MTDIPQAAIDAVAQWLRRNVIADDRTAWDSDYEACALACLGFAEQVWPHNPPRRDPRSTTSGATVLVAPPREHRAGELPPSGWPQDTQGHARPFGFGIQAGGTHG